MTVMNRMPLISIVFGLLLNSVSIVTFVMSGNPSFTVWIPSIAGVPILIAGLIAQKSELLKHAMHGAAMFGLLGFLASAGKLAGTVAKGEFTWKLATVSQVLMAVLCGVFVALCVKSFIEARKARQAAAS